MTTSRSIYKIKGKQKSGKNKNRITTFHLIKIKMCRLYLTNRPKNKKLSRSLDSYWDSSKKSFLS